MGGDVFMLNATEDNTFASELVAKLSSFGVTTCQDGFS